MKTILSVLVVCLVVLGAIGVAMVSWQFLENRQLKATNEQLAQALQTAEDSVAKISQERDDTALQFQRLETKEQELRERVASLEDAAKAADSKPQPYRVRAFVGRESIGDAWMVPHDVSWDEEIGRYTFEPVLWINEAARDAFTVYHTNVVERDVYTADYYDTDYGYPFYPYYYYGGGGRPWNTNRPPVNPQPPVQPAAVSQPPSIRAQMFAPPMSVVNSRPQVVGRPATSPINIKVFAP